MKRWYSFGLTAILAVAAVACGSESGGSSTGSSSSGGASTVSKQITAAEGGTVEASGAKIDFPPGALPGDTTITVAVSGPSGQPDAASIASSVYELGPAMTFLKPVTLTFDFSGTAPMGKTAKIAYLDGGAWKPLEDSAVMGGSVVATTTHFSTYAVLYVAGSGTTVGSCDKLKFDPCGGALEGAWDIVDVCVEFTKTPLDSCPGASIGATLDYDVVLTFGADASYSFKGNATVSSTVFIPSSCIGATCPSDYTATSGGCEQVKMDMKAVDDTGTFAASGTQVTLTQGGTDHVYDYCVNGTTASLKTVQGPDDDSFNILKLQKK